jgi:transposase
MKCKRETDGRKLDDAGKEAIRRRAVRMVIKGEISPEQVAQDLDINRRTIYTWLEKYHYGGLEALSRQPRLGAKPKLSADQLRQLYAWIAWSDPRQHQFPFALWTAALVRDLIRREFDVSLSEVSVSRLLRTLGLSPQRPLRRAIERDPLLVSEWLQQEFPKLQARAKREKALIFFADEAGIRSDYHAGTTWAPVGLTPVVKRAGTRFSVNMLSAINAGGHFRFMLHEGRVTGEVFACFLQRLVEGMTRKILLVVDNVSIHRAKEVRKRLTPLADRLELVFLPPYSPQLNPDEGVWARVKQEVGKQTVLTKEDLISKAQTALQMLQSLPEAVRAIFGHPDFRYAAE